jgi:putative heme iron utilization protein
MTDDVEKYGSKIRRLIRASDRATLATNLAGENWPYGSFVMVACDFSAAPLLLISDLAEHTNNLTQDDHASLLFEATAGLTTPLTGLRVTLLGRIERCADETLLARYVRRHPDAAGYVGFADFNLYRMQPERVHMVAGFGEIDWFDALAVLFDGIDAAALAAGEADIVEHMNADHADALTLYAEKLLGLSGEGWRMTGVDPEGCDLRLGGACARLDFDQLVADPSGARAMLVNLVGKARKIG